ASTTSFANLSVFTSSAKGILAAGGGTLNVTTGSIDSLGNAALDISGVTAGITLTTVSATTLGANSGVNLVNLGGTLTIGTSTTVGSPGAVGINVSGGNATISFGATTVNG